MPKCEGTYVGRMAVFACTVVQNKRISGQNVQPEYVTLKATAEMPNIEVYFMNTGFLLCSLLQSKPSIVTVWLFSMRLRLGGGVLGLLKWSTFFILVSVCTCRPSLKSPIQP